MASASGLLAVSVSVSVSVSTASAADALSDDNLVPHISNGALSHITLDEINAYVVYPSNWHAAFSQGKLMQSLVITGPKHSERSESSARFTINPVSNLMRVRFRRVSEQVEAFVRSLSASPSVELLSNARIHRGDYVGRDLLLQTKPISGSTRQERRWYLAHDARDWLVIVSFAADASEWQDLKAVRSTMFSKLLLR